MNDLEVTQMLVYLLEDESTARLAECDMLPDDYLALVNRLDSLRVAILEVAADDHPEGAPTNAPILNALAINAARDTGAPMKRCAALLNELIGTGRIVKSMSGERAITLLSARVRIEQMQKIFMQLLDRYEVK